MAYGKIAITGEIVLRSGLHIGGSQAYSAIGAVDSPVIKDPLTKLPMIPGSSIKGKLRSLLARKYNKGFVEHKDDDERILRLFGSQERIARILVSDAVMSTEEEARLLALGAEATTEVKFENTIGRVDGVANPRQIQRVIAGARFPFEIIYEYYDEEEVFEDMAILKEGLELLEYDYLGGHGTRGYGRIEFDAIDIWPVVGSEAEALAEQVKGRW